MRLSFALGAIGMVLSSSVRSPITGLGISNGLRPGLAMVAKDMADEFGPRGVRIFGLLPGRILTDRMRQLDAANPAARGEALSAIPLGRYGEPSEVAALVAFLCSDDASYINGGIYTVDGGSKAR
jgi:3-oxoacyl-[acyl-carrier protein] reductase